MRLVALFALSVCVHLADKAIVSIVHFSYDYNSLLDYKIEVIGMTQYMD